MLHHRQQEQTEKPTLVAQQVTLLRQIFNVWHGRDVPRFKQVIQVIRVKRNRSEQKAKLEGVDCTGGQGDGSVCS